MKTKNDKLKESIECVAKYNEWRRGAEIPQPDPKELGLAIYDVLVAAEQHRQRLSGEDWQPIETAPRGNMIYAINKDTNQQGVVKYNRPEWEFLNFNGQGTGTGFYPTHWKPLDAPPCDHIPQTGEKV